MKSKATATVCFGFNERKIDYYLINSAGTILSRNSVNVDFEVINSIGAIANQELMVRLLNELIAKYNLPNKVIVRINLRYLDLKRFVFPTMPINELSQIVRDEAVRESIFSFSYEQIAFAYRIIGKSKNDSGVEQNEVLAATLPQNVIDSYWQLFKSARLKLLAIEPVIEGLFKIVPETITTRDKTVIIIRLSQNESELYIWSNNQPQFWRTIQSGSLEPLRLQQEIRTSLEHFNRKNSDSPEIDCLCFFGEEPPFEVIDNLTLKYLKDEPRLDLAGVNSTERSQSKSGMNFLNFEQNKEHNNFSMLFNKLHWFILVMLIIVNLWLGLQTWLGWNELISIKKQYQKSEKEYQLSQEKLTSLLSKSNRPSPDNFDYPNLLEAVRTAVPETMRLETLTVDMITKKIELDGFCLELMALDHFVYQLSRNSFIKAITLVQSNQAIRSGITVYIFKNQLSHIVNVQ